MGRATDRRTLHRYRSLGGGFEPDLGRFRRAGRSFGSTCSPSSPRPHSPGTDRIRPRTQFRYEYREEAFLAKTRRRKRPHQIVRLLSEVSGPISPRTCLATMYRMPRRAAPGPYCITVYVSLSVVGKNCPHQISSVCLPLSGGDTLLPVEAGDRGPVVIGVWRA